MSLIIPEGKAFTPAPEGLHNAVCVDAIDLGLVNGKFGKRHMVALVWQIEPVDPETGARFEIWKRYGATLSANGNLRADLETWRGRAFANGETEGFDLERVVGQPCQLQVMHNTGDDGTTYGNVKAVLPLAPGMAAITPHEYVRRKDRPADTSASQAGGASSSRQAPPPSAAVAATMTGRPAPF